MILNGVIESVEMHRSPSDEPVSALDVNVRITDVRDIGGNLEATFLYEVNYEKDLGLLRMSGRLLVAPPSKEAKNDVLGAWAQGQSTPIGFSQEVINAAYHLCTINSVLVSRIVNISPPIPPLKIDLTKGIQPSAGAMPSRKQKKK